MVARPTMENRGEVKFHGESKAKGVQDDTKRAYGGIESRKKISF